METDTESLIGFLEDLHEHFSAAQVTLIWDGLGLATSKRSSWPACARTPSTQARAAAEAGLKRVSASSQMCFPFLAHTGLTL